jgi:hypothetical protein
MKNIQSSKGLELLHYGEGSVIELRGPSAQILTLQAAGPQLIQWAPEDYRVQDVEVRLQLLDYQPFDVNAVTPTPPPNVIYTLRFGHGRQTFTLPFCPGFFGAFAALRAFSNYTLPHRGHVLRLTAREIFVELQALQDIDGGANPYETVKVAVSFAPTHSTAGNAMPIQHVASGFVANPFPVEAREWRLCDARGLPYAAAAATVDILDMSGRQIAAGVDAVNWAQFQQIPMFGFSWGSVANFLQASFR